MRRFERLREVGFECIAEAIGVERVRGGWGPCPLCASERRGSRDSRGPISLSARRGTWKCFRCQARGDGIALLAAVATGTTEPGTGNWGPVWALAAQHGWCSAGGHEPPVRRPRLPRPAPPPPARPPRHEVAELWEASLEVTRDRKVSAWVQGRGFDPRDVESLDLARVLPVGSLPGWAARGRRSWSESGHRLVVPLCGPSGEIESLHARAPRDGDKGMLPRGFESVGLVMACELGRLVLRGWPERSPRPNLVVGEGIPDFLAWATWHPYTPVFSITSGSWTDEIAARVPNRSHVSIWTHQGDKRETGDKYAERIAATLVGRCAVSRGQFPRKGAA